MPNHVVLKKIGALYGNNCKRKTITKKLLNIHNTSIVSIFLCLYNNINSEVIYNDIMVLHKYIVVCVIKYEDCSCEQLLSI